MRTLYFTSTAVRRAGFTIIELAVTLAIVAVLSVGILVPFVTQVTQRKIADTERSLEQARETLMGFAVATGRLPCPATAASGGVEAFASGGSVADGACASFDGFLPAVTLGFTPIDSAGFGIDSWGTAQSRIRYSVSNQIGNAFTRTNGMRAAGAATMASTALIYVCASAAGVVAGSNCGTAIRLTDNAPAVIWSLGANAATGGTGADEAQNLNADRIFVSHPQTSTSGNEFDDIVTWLSVGNLVSRLVLAGQLP
jgi:prepilin-type N-terminal cleavage/methylation domain-containing protein